VVVVLVPGVGAKEVEVEPEAAVGSARAARGPSTGSCDAHPASATGAASAHAMTARRHACERWAGAVTLPTVRGGDGAGQPRRVVTLRRLAPSGNTGSGVTRVWSFRLSA
jgi:hypothetical protein